MSLLWVISMEHGGIQGYILQLSGHQKTCTLCSHNIYTDCQNSETVSVIILLWKNVLLSSIAFPVLNSSIEILAHYSEGSRTVTVDRVQDWNKNYHDYSSSAISFLGAFQQISSRLYASVFLSVKSRFRQVSSW